MRLNDVIEGDCIEVLGGAPAGFADLVFADPPFNIGYQYDVYDDRRAKSDYLGWSEKWLAAAARALKPNGSFFLAIGDEFVAEHKVRLDALGLTMRNWIVWHYTFGVSCTKKFNRSHAHILYYVKDPKHYTFNPDAVRVPSARMTTYADRRANPVGKLPDDTWVPRMRSAECGTRNEDAEQAADSSIPDSELRTPHSDWVLRPQESGEHFRADQNTWFISRVCGTFKERVNHPCQMPEAVLDRIIRVATNPGDVVLDPFAGSGTTLAVAKKLGRRYLGVELSEQYADGVRKRLQMIDFADDEQRPSNTRVRQKTRR